MEQKLECQSCYWIGDASEFEAPTSDHEPGCPKCNSTDFLDVPECREVTREEYDHKFVGCIKWLRDK